MKEVIQKIEDVNGYKTDEQADYESYEGFKITTNKQEILILVSDRQGCCESWGHLVSEDDTTPFIGSELFDVVKVDEALNSRTLYDPYDGGIIFIDLKTSRGTLQFSVYNAHNGYYGHSVIIESNQLKLEDYL